MGTRSTFCRVTRTLALGTLALELGSAAATAGAGAASGGPPPPRVPAAEAAAAAAAGPGAAAAERPPAPGVPAAEAAAGATSVDDLAWMAGHWRGAAGDDPVEEVWLPPAGGALVGMFRWLKGGEVHLYEMFTIEAEDGGVVLRLRHFHPGLVAWEDADGALRLELEETAPGRAVFTAAEDDGTTRLIYRQMGADALEVVLESTAGGETSRLPFRYTRSPG